MDAHETRVQLDLLARRIRQEIAAADRSPDLVAALETAEGVIDRGFRDEQAPALAALERALAANDSAPEPMPDEDE